jgi:hypothetical protein
MRCFPNPRIFLTALLSALGVICFLVEIGCSRSSDSTGTSQAPSEQKPITDSTDRRPQAGTTSFAVSNGRGTETSQQTRNEVGLLDNVVPVRDLVKLLPKDAQPVNGDFDQFSLAKANKYVKDLLPRTVIIKLKACKIDVKPADEALKTWNVSVAVEADVNETSVEKDFAWTGEAKFNFDNGAILKINGSGVSDFGFYCDHIETFAISEKSAKKLNELHEFNLIFKVTSVEFQTGYFRRSVNKNSGFLMTVDGDAVALQGWPSD